MKTRACGVRVRACMRVLGWNGSGAGPRSGAIPCRGVRARLSVMFRVCACVFVSQFCVLNLSLYLGTMSRF